ncbi:MAG TPA: calcium-binding protein [Actinomycetota bacterium]|nr:calcium-binding protein [Actinomycetota bacterium]
MQIEMAAGDSVGIAQNDAAGTIEFDDADDGTFAACTPVAPIATTTSIVINGDTGDETIRIWMVAHDDTDVTVDWGTINWTINAGTDLADADTLEVDAFFDGEDPVNVVFGASGIDLNNDGDLDVQHTGFEVFAAWGGDGDDLLSAAGSTATGAAFASDITMDADEGDDVLMGGAGDDSIEGWTGDDTVSGGLGDDVFTDDSGNDTVDYSASATAVNANLTTGNASGEGLDTITVGDFENLIGSAQGDTLTGDGVSNVITPGAGDDKVDGEDDTLDVVGGDFGDLVDYSDATAAVTVDLDAGTATGGSGNDTLSDVESVDGSDFDDNLTGDSGDNQLSGRGGADTLNGGTADDDGDLLNGGSAVDVVDYGARTDAVDVSLSADTAGATAGACNDAAEFVNGEASETDCITGVENAILGTGDDSFVGSAFANRVWPNGGQNVLAGDAVGGPATGGDVLDYSVGYTAGVEVNMAGGATAGDSATGFENAIGTEFADTFVGNELSNTLRTGAGDDSVRSGAGDDNVRGGAGKDLVRAGSGDDDAFGGKGNDTLRGGSGDDLLVGGGGKDLCRGGAGGDTIRKCEGKSKARAETRARVARLAKLG